MDRATEEDGRLSPRDRLGRAVEGRRAAEGEPVRGQRLDEASRPGVGGDVGEGGEEGRGGEGPRRSSRARCPRRRRTGSDPPRRTGPAVSTSAPERSAKGEEEE